MGIPQDRECDLRSCPHLAFKKIFFPIPAHARGNPYLRSPNAGDPCDDPMIWGPIATPKHKYVLDILSDTGLLGSRPAGTPLPKGQKFLADQNNSLPDPNKCMRLIKRLLYLNFTRLDITYVVQQLSQFVGALNLQH